MNIGTVRDEASPDFALIDDIEDPIEEPRMTKQNKPSSSPLAKRSEELPDAVLDKVAGGGSPACNPPVGMDQEQAVRTK